MSLPTPRRARWPLHPLSTALALLAIAGVATASAFTAEHGVAVAAAVLLLVAVAGAAAGFANSGST
ncbi:hypothetical protein [Pseudonocardia asaccharolytica]|uniref:Uncharacterized protein n=1 Tax=Pseudonocardia asaccharolytica DSM 44247 = NBRC 16224 TaxID=1123024 RepID=A0A511D1D4_9PSEU|nr:hypothetical protein [Pseudonocardia asaccharolytica]GEL18497.1 hypothetical protein PA7_23340 [Pseudonocardia asaccharolytica DSM 44247 = NBRC 16224]